MMTDPGDTYLSGLEAGMADIERAARPPAIRPARTRIDLPIWVRLHHGDPGYRGDDHLAPSPPSLVSEAWGNADPYGITDLAIHARFERVTVDDATHFSLWGGEDAARFLAIARFPHRLSVKDGRLTIDSLGGVAR